MYKSALNPAQQEALDTLKDVAILGGATGLAGGAGWNLVRLIRSNLAGEPGAMTGEPEDVASVSPGGHKALVLKVPYQVRTKSKEDKPRGLLSLFRKQSSALDWFMGSDSKSVYDVPAVYPASVAAFLGGSYGGMKLISLLNKYIEDRKREQELSDAAEEYEKALTGAFTPTPGSKVKAVKLASELSDPNVVKSLITNKINKSNTKLASISEKLDKFTKSALISDVYDAIVDWLGRGTRAGVGAYAAYAPLAAGAAGMGTYHYARSLNPEALAARAHQAQLALRNRERAPEVYTQMVPVDEKGRPVKKEEIEEG